ncbi:manganese transport protein [Bowdeniella nasicola]|uniref:Manganese transport protein n=1 Tax=Bowdeniella nasicola TaxID=208480 RepID=A0A1H3VRL8_9ACTO|nr:Nramp family divalent metal transporter [Bowdeniella nasicola]SDZ76758.1 manganese transport protein [Bowdeniella nasicola]
MITLLGPAFVAAVAYVDPGNVAANITAGARYGYLLVWVLVLANAMAVIVQYQSAKLGIVTDSSLPHLLGRRLKRRSRLAFWGQAEVVAAATDLAEVIGGAIALHLLFGVPLVVGGVIVGVISIALLSIQNRQGQRPFELVVIALLVIVTLGFLAGLVFSPPSAAGVLGGMVPRFDGVGSLLVAASMLGATVMPHAIYLHSSLVKDRHAESEHDKEVLLRASRIDVSWALIIAGAVNIGLLLLAASALAGVDGTDTIEGAHAAISSALGPTIGIVFAVGLLASGLASTSVGAYAGAEIMAGLLHVKIPLLARRVITLLPALIILALGAEPTWALVISQVVLSFGIPLAIIPLMKYTRDRSIMGRFADGRALRWISTVIAILIVALNAALIILTALGIE